MSGSGIAHSVASAGPFKSWAASHTGPVRALNEDSYVNRPDLGLWAVADGAGGHQSGEVASAAVADALQSIPADLSAGEILVAVRTALEATHASLRAEGVRRGSGSLVATTVVAIIARADHYACLWAGDSRAYLLRAATLTRISRDHSLVQDLVDSGAIAAEDAENHPRANVITRAVGAEADLLDLEKRTGGLLPGDRLLLCSDGICKALPDSQIAELLAMDEDAAAERLVMAALNADARDNVTAVTIEVMAAERP